MDRTDPRWREVVHYYLNQGRSQRWIGQKLKLAPESVQFVLNEENIARRPVHDRMKAVVGESSKVFWHSQGGKCALCRRALDGKMQLLPGPGSTVGLFLACGPCSNVALLIGWNPAVVDGLHAYLHAGKRESEVPQFTGGFYQNLSGPPVLAYLDGRVCVDAGQGQYVFVNPKRVVYPKK
jgi:hypothetical protein